MTNDKIMKVIKYANRSEWPSLLKRPVFETASLNEKVKAVLDDVKTNGDAAIRKYTTQFDKVELTDLLVPEVEIDEAVNSLDSDLKTAIERTQTAGDKK